MDRARARGVTGGVAGIDRGALENRRALLERAGDHQRAGEIAAADAIYHRLIEGWPRAAEPHHALGMLYARSGRIEAAIERLGDAVRLVPDNAAYHDHLAQACLAAGKPGEAERAFRRAIELNPDLLDAYFNLGALLRQRGRLAEAVACYRHIMAADSKAVHARINLGIALQETGAYAEAIAALESAIAIDPRSAEAHYNLAIIFTEQRRLIEAEQAYRTVLSIRPDAPWAHVNLGFVLQEQERHAEAIACYRRSLSLAPDLAQAHANLGGALFEQGDLSGALAAVRRAIELEPGNPGSHVNLAQILRAQRDFAGAEANLRRALALRPGLAVAQAHLAIVLQQLGRPEAARVLLDYPRLVRTRRIDRPTGWSSIEAFNDELARYVRGHPTLMDEPPGRSTVGGSVTLGILHADDPPISALRQFIGICVGEYLATTVKASSSIFAPAPSAWQLNGWGVVLRAQDYQSSHFHPAAIVSGVYYVRIPEVVKRSGTGDAGCIRFGEPEAGTEPAAVAAGWQTLSVRPEDGLIVLFPSYFWHRTIPFESEEDRICVAFDVLPGLGEPARSHP